MQQKKAVALILALFALLFMTLLIVAFMDTITIEQQIATNHIWGVKAELLADAAVETAIYNLRSNSSYSGTGSAITYPSGSNSSYNVSVSSNLISATGTVNGLNRTLNVTYNLAGANVNIINWTWAE